MNQTRRCATVAALCPEAVLVDRLEALLKVPDLDCLLIVSPNYLHARQIVQIAAMRPPPLLVEKPLYTDPVDPALPLAGDHNGSTFYQHLRFVSLERGQGMPKVTLQDGALAVAMGLAARQSAATGQAVTL